MGEPPNGDTSFILGALAAAGGVCVMIPMDTVKTRLVIQVIYFLRYCFYSIINQSNQFFKLQLRVLEEMLFCTKEFGIVSTKCFVKKD